MSTKEIKKNIAIEQKKAYKPIADLDKLETKVLGYLNILFPAAPQKDKIDWAVDIIWNNADLDDCFDVLGGAKNLP